MNTKINPQPEYDVLNAFDAENNVEPVRSVAERIARGYGLNAVLRRSLEDEISSAIEDARDIGKRRGALEVAVHAGRWSKES